ncbi:hypothetical protein CC80DRAFT_326582 [Byssothecium circinans]|uniref:Uncharacterized protein n=1 Tax=Byssothecium circinans TaxID=147558 RepID=A0A6A5U401_9PLEO|nr:hypothetical protein CC80DRAFT_326582 [Byssothecium circinans]
MSRRGRGTKLQTQKTLRLAWMHHISMCVFPRIVLAETPPIVHPATRSAPPRVPDRCSAVVRTARCPLPSAASAEDCLNATALTAPFNDDTFHQPPHPARCHYGQFRPLIRYRSGPVQSTQDQTCPNVDIHTHIDLPTR